MAVFDEVHAPNFVLHNPGLPNMKDREGLKKHALAGRTSDTHFTIHDLIAEGDKVVARWTLEATDAVAAVSFGTPPTGKQLTLTGIMISHFEGGKIVEQWYEGDYLGLMKQLTG